MPPEPDVLVYAVGWLAGWLLLWWRRPLPAATGSGSTRRRVGIVIPARDEGHQIADVVTALAAQARPGDELVVVDDHSGDDTAARARAAGARVVPAPPLPDGWLGKPHACAVGAAAVGGEVIVFVDADVRPAPDVLDRIVAAVDAAPAAVVSVQPWHRTGTRVEQLSLLANTVALMGSGAFTAWSPRGTATMAFGPVLAVDRRTYEAIGGHAAATVRASAVEDLQLARAVGAARVFGAATDTSFRMYRSGRELLDGWSRTITAGAGATPWWLAVAIAAWVWSLAGGWAAAPWAYPLSALQCFVLVRRAGSIHPLTAVVYPVLVLALTAMLVRSAWRRVRRRPTVWKRRSVPAH